MKHALPRMFFFGSGPQTCESKELFRLSPITNTSPAGTVCFSITYFAGSSFSSSPLLFPFTKSSPRRTSTSSPATATTRLMNTSLASAAEVFGVFGGWKMITSPGTGSCLNRYVIFSAIKRSPTSNTGYIESEGMNLGSAMVARNASDTANVMSTVATSSRFRRNPSGTHSGQSMSMSSSSSPPSPSPPPPALASSTGAGGSPEAARARTASRKRAEGTERAARRRAKSAAILASDPPVFARTKETRPGRSAWPPAARRAVAPRATARGGMTTRSGDAVSVVISGRAVREQIMSHAPTLS